MRKKLANITNIDRSTKEKRIKNDSHDKRVEILTFDELESGRKASVQKLCIAEQSLVVKRVSHRIASKDANK